MKIISFNTEVEISSLKLYISYIYIPIIFSIVENVFKMHDLFGRIFGIRRLFSGTVIFPEYIKQLKIEVKLSRLGLLKKYLKDKNLQLNFMVVVNVDTHHYLTIDVKNCIWQIHKFN